MIYTIERLQKSEDFTEDVWEFLNEYMPKIAEIFDNKLNHTNCKPEEIAKKCLFLICKRDGRITGQHISYFTRTMLDPEKLILQQMHFYAKPDSGRTAFHLFKKFIDIGKVEADHIITMLTSQTNIKPTTLEKMGFKELETLYRLEV